jgi:hypothetical protein
MSDELAAARERIADLEAKLQRHEWRNSCICTIKLNLAGKQNCEPGPHHEMYCRNYVGPLTHTMRFERINETFGGFNYRCTCGGYYRQGGWAGHGPEDDEMAEPVCPKIDETWRGPKEDQR